MKVLARSAFRAIIADITGEPIQDDLLVSFADCQLDSFHMMEVVSRLDALGVVLDEDSMMRVTTLQELYEECIRAATDSMTPDARTVEHPPRT